MVGDVTEAQLRTLLDRSLGLVERRAEAAAQPGRAPVAPHRTLLIDKRGASQSYLALGAPGLDRRSPDFVAATVMFEVLGGGTSSRLFRTLREEKGYTYGMGAGADARRLGRRQRGAGERQGGGDRGGAPGPPGRAGPHARRAGPGLRAG